MKNIAPSHSKCSKLIRKKNDKTSITGSAATAPIPVMILASNRATFDCFVFNSTLESGNDTTAMVASTEKEKTFEFLFSFTSSRTRVPEEDILVYVEEDLNTLRKGRAHRSGKFFI